MFARFLGVKEGMGPAEDDGHAAPAELIGDVVSPVRGQSRGADGDQVEAAIKANRVQLFIQQCDLPAWRGQGGQIGQGQGHHAPMAGLEHRAVRLRAIVGWLDYEKLVRHAAAVVVPTLDDSRVRQAHGCCLPAASARGPLPTDCATSRLRASWKTHARPRGPRSSALSKARRRRFRSRSPLRRPNSTREGSEKLSAPGHR